MIHNIKLKLGMLLATLPLVILMTSGSALAANGCSTSAEVTSLTSDEVAMVQLINNYRAQNSLSQLQVSKSLTCAARFMSGDMVAKNYFDHTEPSGRTFGARIAAFGYSGGSAGENIAAGYSLAQYTFDQWKNSPGHNQNMLYPSWQVIGIGKATGGSYGYYWTSDFGGTATASDLIALPTTPPSDTTAPTTNLSLAATSISTGQSTTITVAASDNTGGSGLAKIELYQNNTLVYQTSSSPLSYTFSSSTAGNHSFYAKAYDVTGNVATTSTQNITVTATTPPPTGDTTAPSLTFTTSHSSVSLNQVVTVKASAADNTGGSGLAKIELYQNNSLIADGTGADLNFYFVSPVAGSFTFLAKAYDKSGNLTTSTGKVVTVTTTTAPSDTTAPSANLSLSATSVSVNTSVTATVTGSDNTGGSGLAKLELYRNGILITQTTTSPLSSTFTSSTAGTYSFYAKAYDTAGNVTTTPTQTLTVTAATPPADTTAPSATLSLASTSTTTNTPVALSVSASDNTGGSGLAKIELYQNNSLVTQSTTSPLSYSFPSSTAGTYSFYAKAYDLANNQTTTTTQSIVVTSSTTLADPPTNQSTSDYEIVAASNAGFTVKEGSEIYYKIRLKARPSSIITLNLEGNAELYQKSPDDYFAPYASFNSNNWNVYKYIILRAYVKDDINGDRLRTLTIKPNSNIGGVNSVVNLQIKVTD